MYYLLRSVLTRCFPPVLSYPSTVVCTNTYYTHIRFCSPVDAPRNEVVSGGVLPTFADVNRGSQGPEYVRQDLCGI
jgi:hypothetical protein